jgi:hypothetical protein
MFWNPFALSVLSALIGPAVAFGVFLLLNSV